ncbi:RNA-directed DNA polymerase [Delftia sp. UME58]|uniref:RNA-directed DNA polymerase n=1 Tax=Delftia sp. UME58 TaxID=1862322 RepID=UPI0015FEFB03|nr:RNA-directed DNA polymerase [Delftia sp. UME58]
MPVLTSKELAAVGYSGFRQGTQIDSIWNTYLLSLVIAIGEEIEARRVSPSMVFSYRYKPDFETGSLFDKEVGWHQFQAAAKQYSSTNSFVLRCDISDFYPRIYHHRLENALRRATPKHDIANRIMELVGAIAAGPSYGLPVGGPASRLLSELLLNGVDRLLVSDGIKFIRFVDDYILFADSREKAHSVLIRLNEILLTNEGLSLQKSKTRILSSAEFLATSDFSESQDGESHHDELARTFRRLRVHYDPYSPTATEDYDSLLAELSKFDIVGMLGRELKKSRIDEGLTRRLVAATKHLPAHAQNDAVRSMIASLDLLYPIFPSVMQLCKTLMPSLEPVVQNALYSTIRQLIAKDSYITQVPSNLAFALRVLVSDTSEETEVLLAAIYKNSSSMMIRRDIILLMAFRQADYWLSDCRTKLSTLTGWERRALLIASFTLGDEGKHWRDSVKNDQSPFDKLVLKWTGENKQKKGINWKVPV